jgi:hypothetical protein
MPVVELACIFRVQKTLAVQPGFTARGVESRTYLYRLVHVKGDSLASGV